MGGLIGLGGIDPIQNMFRLLGLINIFKVLLPKR